MSKRNFIHENLYTEHKKEREREGETDRQTERDREKQSMTLRGDVSKQILLSFCKIQAAAISARTIKNSISQKGRISNWHHARSLTDLTVLLRVHAAPQYGQGFLAMVRLHVSIRYVQEALPIAILLHILFHQNCHQMLANGIEQELATGHLLNNTHVQAFQPLN